MERSECLICLLSSDCPDHTNSYLNKQTTLKIHSLRKGHILFQQDHPNQELYFIVEGVVKIYSYCESGKQVIHALLPQGSIVGLAALTEGRPSPYSAEIVEDAKIFFLNRNVVIDLFKTHPVFTEKFIHHITRLQEEAYNRNDDLINFQVRQRMARCLLKLGEDFGERDNNTLRIRLRLNRQELASVIGVAPETAIRFLSEFKKKEIISEDDHQIIIIDKEALKNIGKIHISKRGCYEVQKKSCIEAFRY